MNNQIDEKISTMIAAVEHDIPREVELELLQKMADMKKKKKTGKLKRFLWYPATAVASLALVFFLVLPMIQKTTGNHNIPLEEIKTVFELKDKNITILWCQKKDFQLRRNEP